MWENQIKMQFARDRLFKGIKTLMDFSLGKHIQVIMLHKYFSVNKQL
jgi:hypothetical protein